jgi:deoxyribonuclease-4
MNTYDEWSKQLERYAEVLGPESLQQMHIHLSGIKYGLKGEQSHLPLEEADLDLIALLKALQAFECRGRILCESPEMEKDAQKIRTAWLELTGEEPG